MLFLGNFPVITRDIFPLVAHEIVGSCTGFEIPLSSVRLKKEQDEIVHNATNQILGRGIQ